MPSKGKKSGSAGAVWLKVVAAGLAAGVMLTPAASSGSHGADVVTCDPAGCVVLTVR
jgi:hypothetical protein